MTNIAHNGYVLCAEYISTQNIVVTSGTDNTLMFWDPTGYVLLNKIPTREIQLVCIILHKFSKIHT